jgi:mono/diheme cytochrome c family protein
MMNGNWPVFLVFLSLQKNETMFKAIYWTHVISVNIFMLIYLIKTIQLLLNKNEGLEKFKKITKVPEMIVSVLFLGTGIYLITQIPEIKSLLIIKLVAVALSIPIAIVGFKKGNKMLASLSMLLIITAYGLAEMSKKQASSKKSPDMETATGTAKDSVHASATDSVNGAVDPNGFPVAMAKKKYKDNCSGCHGDDGKLGMAGASDLSKSTIDAMEAKDIVTNGKTTMPAFGEQLNPGEINAVVNYIQSIKKK